MRVTWHRLLIPICVLGFQACKQIEAPAPARISLDSTLAIPESELHVPVYFPVQEQEDLINEKLKDKIIQAHLAINKKEDSLHISVSRFRPVTLAYDGDHGITYKLPVQIDGFLDSKVLGITIQNKVAMRARVIITLFSELYLDNKWNLAPKTELKKIEWVENPKLNVVGINFNLKPPIEKALENNKQKIVDKLDESAKDIIKIRSSIEKLWRDIQKPIRVNRKIVPVWLKVDATDIDGKLFARSKDTLMIMARLNARTYSVLDSAAAVTKPAPLPRLRREVDEDPSLQVYAHATLPFKMLNEIISQVTDTMKFQFPGHTVRIHSSEIYGTPEGIAIRINLRGDLNANVYLRGTIGFDTLTKQLRIENFTFDLNSEQSLLNAADWFAHDVIIDRIKPYMIIPLENVFDVIPVLINKGIEKGKLGQKINIHFETFDLNVYQHLVTTDNIQIIASVKGRAKVELQKALFDKKKKTAK